MKKMTLAAAVIMTGWMSSAFAQMPYSTPAAQGIMMAADDFPRVKPVEKVKKPVNKSVRKSVRKPVRKHVHKHKAKHHAKSKLAQVKPCAPVKPVEPPSCNKPK